MTKFKTLVLIALLSVLLAACGGKVNTKVNTGNVMGGKYENQSLGLCFKMPPNSLPFTLSASNRAMKFSKRADQPIDINNSAQEILIGITQSNHNIIVSVVNPYKIDGAFPKSVKNLVFKELRDRVTALKVESTAITTEKINQNEYYRFSADYTVERANFTSYAHYYFIKHKDVILLFQVAKAPDVGRSSLQSLLKDVNLNCF